MQCWCLGHAAMLLRPPTNLLADETMQFLGVDQTIRPARCPIAVRGTRQSFGNVPGEDVSITAPGIETALPTCCRRQDRDVGLGIIANVLSQCLGQSIIELVVGNSRGPVRPQPTAFEQQQHRPNVVTRLNLGDSIQKIIDRKPSGTIHDRTVGWHPARLPIVIHNAVQIDIENQWAITRT